jgi:isocitrate dehydrogenase
MMLNHMGWNDAAALIERGVQKTIAQKRVTYDLARQMKRAQELKTSQFADAIIENM